MFMLYIRLKWPICRQTQIKQRTVQKLRPPYPLLSVDRRGTRANIEIHSFIKINILIIYFHSKNSKRIGINE